MTRTWAGSPSRIATSEGPWDSPAVSHRSMGEVSQPHMRAASAVPQTRPTSAPTDHERTEGERPLEQAAVAPRQQHDERRDDEQHEARPEPDRERAPPGPAEHEPDQRGQPHVAEAHAGRPDEPQHPEERPGEHHRDERAHEGLALPRREPHRRHHDDRGEGDGYDDDAGQQAGVPVDHRQGDRDRGQRHQPQQRPVEPGGRAEQRPRHGRQTARCATRAAAGRRCRRRAAWGARRRVARPPPPPSARARARARSAAAPAGRPARRARPRRAPPAQGRSGCRSRGHSTGMARCEGAFACFSQHVDRDRPSGEELDLQHGLVHEQVQPADDRPVPQPR